jgi:hypothetical protein
LGNKEKRLAAPCCQPFTLQAYSPLSVPAAVGSATTVEAASAADCAAANCAAPNCTAPNCTAAGVSASGIPAGVATGVSASVTAAGVATGIAATIAASVTADVAVPVVPRTTIVSTMTPAPVIPGPDPDKCSADKPLRTVEAIRRAGIRIIGVVAVRTYRRAASIARARVGVALIITLVGIALVCILVGIALVCILVGIALVVSGANSRFNLRLRVSKRHRQDCQQRNISQITHI